MISEYGEEIIDGKKVRFRIGETRIPMKGAREIALGIPNRS